MRISDWSSDVCSSDLFTDRRSIDHARRATQGMERTDRIGADRVSAHVMVELRQPVTDLGEFFARIFTEHRRHVRLRCGVRIAAFGIFACTLRQRLDLGADVATFAKCLDQIRQQRSEEHTSELQSLMRISYAVFCLQKKKRN